MTWKWWIAAIALGVILELWSRWSRRRGARKLLATMETLYQGAHEYRATSLESYPYIDRAFYEATTATLRQAGFTWLGDVEDVTVSGIGPGLPTAIRVLASGDGTVTAGIFHVRVAGTLGLLLRLLRLNPIRAVDLETALDDGRFLATGNAPMVGKLAQPPELVAEFLPPAAPVQELVARHHQRLDEYLRQHPQSKPHVTRTLVEALRHQERLEGIKARFRQARPGMVTAEEMSGVAGKPFRHAAAELSAEMVQQQQQQAAAAPPPAGGEPVEPR